MDYPGLHLCLLSIWIVSVPAQERGMVISLSGSFFEPGFLESIPGTPETIDEDDPITHRLPHNSDATDITALVNDPFEQTLYYLERDTRSLYRMDNFDTQFSHPNLTSTSIHAGISEYSASIAFDWIRKVLYWVDAHHGWICLQPANTNDSTMYKVVVDKLSYPTAIAVDAIEAKMFYFDLRSSSGRITSASLSGEGQIIIVHRTLGYVPTMITDPTEKRLYIVDSDRMVMESMTYFGNDRRTIRKLTGYNIQSLSVTKNDICIVEPNNYFVVCFEKMNGSISLFLSYWSNSPTATSYYDMSFLVTDQTDGCQNKGCQHLCAANGTREQEHVCLCKEGYTLNSDGKTCTEDHYLHAAGVLISNGTHICMSEVRVMSGGSLNPICIADNFTNVLHLAADASTNTVFYYDKANRNIYSHEIVSGVSTVIASAGNVTGLVYDWLTNNLYFAEADTGHIRVVNVNDKATSVVYSGIIGLGPIAISPHNKTLFWMTDSSIGVNVYAGKFEGTTFTVTTIVHPDDVFYPTALYSDPSTGRLFYLDFFTLTAVNADGSDPIYLYTHVSTYDLVIYKRYALWISDEDGYLYGTSYLNPNKDTVLHFAEFGQVTAIAVFDISLQQQELRLFSMLPILANFKNNNFYTVPMHENFLLVADISTQKLFQTSLTNGNNISQLELEQSFYATGSAYNPEDSKIYIADAYSESIFSIFSDGKNRSTIVQLSGLTPERLAFDNSNGYAYYSVSDPFSFDPDGFIGVYNPEKKIHRVLTEGIEFPRGLAVFPSEGYLYFADYGTFRSSIERVWMDGTNRTVIISSDSDALEAPTGLTIDYANKRVYWVDNYNDDIHSCDLDGNDVRFLLVEPRGYLTDIVLQGDFLYYVGTNIPSIMKVEKATGNKVPYMDHMAELGALETVSIQPGDMQPVNTICQNNNGECSTFCLPTPGSRACACAEGVLLLDDMKTCQGVKQECTKNIPFGSLVPDQDCYAIEGYQCRVTCSEGYRRTNVTFDKMTCLSTGQWEYDVNTLCEPITCPTEVPNGSLMQGCDTSINQVCSVTCDTDYVPGPTGALVSCQRTGYWTPDIASVCTPIVRCNPVIQNGALSAGCKVGTLCNIRCGGNHVLSPHVVSVHCRRDGSISVNPNTVCEPIKCPDLDNVMLETSCLSNAGNACGFTCKDGFRQVYMGQVTCRSDSTWSMTSNQMCQAVTCSGTLQGTILPENTIPQANNDYTFECQSNYVKNTDIRSVRCLSSGTWSIKASSLCAEVTVADPEKQTSSGSIGSGVGIGVAVMVALILVILAVGYFYYRSRRTSKARFVESPNVKFSGNNEFHNPTAQIDSRGITNPQYDMTGGATNNPYDTMGSASQNPYDNLSEVKNVDAPETNGSSANPYHKF
ncbi:low-density lipoprotein receptor-related protein 4-like [Argopecten irradians]|uniref:low-density lipoprotein receptor-related protein 4-like n=1 Tax=Argopecten irradians TaxID=31199 RepID=UPI003720DF04